MKKNKIMVALTLFLTVVGFSSAGFATEDTFSSGEIVIGTNSTALTIGLSPKVSARYVNPGASESTAQWFSIATAHPGGNIIYGTAQNLNNIYTLGFTTGTALTSTVLAIPASANSASDWSTNGWDM